MSLEEAALPYPPEVVEQLWTDLAEVQGRETALKERCVQHPFKTAGAREHADHGLARRLGTMIRCMDRVFALLPPELDAIPDRDVTVDATVNIQAFVMNAFGCCENLAWIWVYEKDVRRPDGGLLPPLWVGLGEKYDAVRDSLSDSLRQCLQDRAEWFANLKNFRDALAHRIPLYIPLFTLDPADGDQFQALEHEAVQALRRHDFDGYERLSAEKMALARFQPIMAHSLTAGGYTIKFHSQLIADIRTIFEMAELMLGELTARA